MTEFTLKRNEGGNPIGDMDEIIREARQRLQTTERLTITPEVDGDDVILKVEAR